MYDVTWHDQHAFKTRRSAETILGAVADFHAFQSVVDVGCGSGLWLAAAQGLGCGHIDGLDGPWTDLDTLRIDRAAFRVADLGEPFSLGRRYDLAISLEVAEHVAPAASEIFVENLVDHADAVLFGAAIPYQGGFRHINERWQSYWRKLFEARGYVAFDMIRPLVWDDEDVHWWYKQNCIVYVRSSRTDLVHAAAAFMRARGIAALPTDIVHPEKYEAIASYDQIAFKPLARRLPSRLAGKLKTLATLRA